MTSAVLVVEDDKTLRLLITDALSALPIEVFACSSADLALCVLEHAQPIDLVLADIHTPGQLDGWGLAQIVWGRWPDLPVVLTSGHPISSSTRLPSHSTFIGKPWAVKTLVDTVQARLP
jgi:DNA-binding NtrC family response regulator